MPAGLRPQTLGTRRLRRRYVVTNAKEYGTSLGSVPQDAKERQNFPSRPEKKIRANVRGVRVPLEVNLHSRIGEKPGGKLGVQETGRGCERRQLFPPPLSRQCCHDTHGFYIVGMRYSLCISEYRRKNEKINSGYRFKRLDTAARCIEK